MGLKGVIRFIGMFTLAPLLGLAIAGESGDYIEKKTGGSINWTSMSVTAVGLAAMNPEPVAVPEEAEKEALFKATEKAKQNLFEVIGKLRLNSAGLVDQMMGSTPLVASQLRQLIDSAAVDEIKRSSTDKRILTVRLKMSLLGGVAQLLLPRDIKQIESVRPVQKSGPESNSATPAEAYTGLIVDAGSIDALPALAPIIIDENGTEIYGAAFVSREYAVQKGMCRYVQGLDNAHESRVAGSKPLIVKGLRAEGPGRGGIIISNSNAAKLRKDSKHLSFLKQCNVVIVLRPPD